MKIHEFKGFPNPSRVRIALAEKGLIDQVSFISVNVPEGEHREPAFLAKNPWGTVPALELDDGTVISECTAITEYIDHLDGQPSLTGRTARERAIIHMMQRRAESGLLDAATDYFHHATPGLGPKLELNPNKDWGEARGERVGWTLRQFDAVLAKTPYLAGDAFSVADITAFVGLGFAEFAKIAIPEGLTHVEAWRRRVAERPSVAAA